jgi:hypothetical protein
MDAAPPLRATLRLDDDDALTADFADHMQSFLVPGHEDHAVTFPKGYVLDLRGDDIGGWEQWLYCHSAGLALLNRRPWDRHVYHLGGHATVPEHVRTIADGSRPMSLRVRHGHNDTNVTPRPVTFRGDDATLSTLADGRLAFLRAPALIEAQRASATGPWVRPEGA